MVANQVASPFLAHTGRRAQTFMEGHMKERKCKIFGRSLCAAAVLVLASSQLGCHEECLGPAGLYALHATHANGESITECLSWNVNTADLTETTSCNASGQILSQPEHPMVECTSAPCATVHLGRVKERVQTEEILDFTVNVVAPDDSSTTLVCSATYAPPPTDCPNLSRMIFECDRGGYVDYLDDEAIAGTFAVWQFKLD